MGYYTTHTLTAAGNITPEIACQIDEALFQKNIVGYALDNYCLVEHNNTAYWGCSDCAKWYDHEDDMLEISRMFPDVTFQLCGEGDEQGDLWEEYYHNGEAERCSAEVVFPKPTRIKWPPVPDASVDTTGILDLLKENTDHE